MGEAGGLGQLIAGLLYGGITEEVMLRWGMMTFIVWVIWRRFQKGRPHPSAGAVWAAILLAAVLFGIGHLPATAAFAPLDGMLVVRTVALNALGGVLFGWLFWRRHLEAAMVAHASAHVGFALAGLVGLG
jgi:membrane protease YdiL (CAAX protease family)